MRRMLLVVLAACAHPSRVRCLNGSSRLGLDDPFPPDAVVIPGGSYHLGCRATVACASNPARTVVAAEFAIDIRQVVARELAACVREGACGAAEDGRPGTADPFEVPLVTIDEARAYCRWRRGHVPSADEWEIAARGHTGWLYPWGDAWDPQRVPRGQIRDVSLDVSIGYSVACSNPRSASVFGVEDLAANAQEFVQSAGFVALRGHGPGPLRRDPAEYSVVETRPAQDDDRAAFRCAYSR